MNEWIVRANLDARGNCPVVRVTPESAGWTYVGFSVYRLDEGNAVELRAAPLETVVTVIEGACDVRAGGESFFDVGGRASVFDDAPPEAVYSPPGTDIKIEARGPAEVAVATAPAARGAGPARRIVAADIPVEHRGDGSTLRHIRHILDECHPAQKLLLVEVVTPGGHWSSYPPHKHDEEIPGVEAYLEETYYHRLFPAQGRAWQRVYDDSGRGQMLAPGDGDVVLVPHGYHPVACPPGFTSYYLNVMAGHNRVWKYRVDPDFRHLVPRSGDITGAVTPGVAGPKGGEGR